MNEAYLQYIWRYKRLPLKGLYLNDGRPFEVLDFGTYNTNAGADFFNAKIKIDDTIWVGNIEVHVKSSDWNKHRHQNDSAYNNVILHVVYEHDKDITTSKNQTIPTFELKKYVDENHWMRYQNIVQSSTWIPCQKHIKDVNEFTKFSWLERLSIERLERKTELIKHSLEQEKYNWEEVFYRYLLMSFGAKVNKEQFYAVAQNLPLHIIQKNADDAQKLEALFLGVSGLLGNDFIDAYPKQLQAEYSYLKTKYQLNDFEQSFLKYAKLRPPNFPHIRLVQFSKLMHQRTNWFAFCLEAELQHILEELDVVLDGYWENHYVFDKTSTVRNKRIGNAFKQVIVINTIVPFLFLYAQFSNKSEYQEKAFKLLELLPSEKNNIVEKWLELGVKSSNAFTSQALLELNNEYCSQKKCVNCAIGVNILNAKPNDK
jgi:hypothetical protein